jgi:hypothetical protein
MVLVRTPTTGVVAAGGWREPIMRAWHAGNK